MTHIWKNPNMSVLMKFIDVGAELFNTDRKTHRQTLIVPLHDIGKAPKEWQYYNSLRKTNRLKEM